MTGLITRGDAIRGAVILAFIAVALFFVPTFSSQWIETFTGVGIYTILSLGLGLLYGRVGLISLGQMALYVIGVWTAARLSYATSLPFEVLLLLSGLVACAFGLLIGLPAIRLSGLYLALITLMAAGAVTVVLSAINFPNGGGGFTGRTYLVDLSGVQNVRTPGIAHEGTAYYRYVVVVAAIMFLIALIHLRTKPGRAWAAIRESEPAALAAGVNTVFYKLWAFGLAAFMAGVAGCLFAGQTGQPTIEPFQTQDSLFLLATTLIGGIFSLWGAVVAGCFNQLVPFILNVQWGVNQNFLPVLFGAGLLQVLLTAPGGIAQQFPKDMANLFKLLTKPFRRKPAASGESP